MTFTPHGEDTKQYSIPIIGIEGRNGHIVSEGGPVRHDIGITRSISTLNGDIRKGSRVRTDLFVYESDPETSLGLDYEEIKFDSELGELDAWVVPQKSDNWAIFIHGHRSNRRESLRLTSLFHRLGYNQMLITYRNDEGAPVDKAGYHMFGITEWKDLESAVKYSLKKGAKNINLVGHSMGGAIVLKFLLESKLSNQISKKLKVDESVRAMIDFNNGAKGIFWASTLAKGGVYGLRIRIFGSKGSVEWVQNDPGYLKFNPANKAVRFLEKGFF